MSFSEFSKEQCGKEKHTHYTYVQFGEGITPVNPGLTLEGRELLEYLASVYGKKTLMAQDKFSEAEKAYEASAKYPAIISVDLSGWSDKRWDEKYRRNLQKAVDDSIRWWKEKGGIVSFAWHWANPLSENGDYVGSKSDFMTIDVGRVVTQGTEEYKAAMEDMAKHADYLQQLKDAGVPVLWRPFHEIEGGWFWWTDSVKPENTAELWRIMYNYFVNERGLDNLIWVYSSALTAGPGREGSEALEQRKRFYPGGEYVDIAGIDIYVNDYCGWEHYSKDAYGRAFEIMSEVAPGKMLALCECQGLPNPDIMKKDGPVWLWCLPWYIRDDENWNPPAWVKSVYDHEISITHSELPKWKTK